MDPASNIEATASMPEMAIPDAHPAAPPWLTDGSSEGANGTLLEPWPYGRARRPTKKPRCWRGFFT
jgi:hypothetical protein